MIWKNYMGMIFILVLMMGCTPVPVDQEKERIKDAVLQQMESYPHSTLTDIYKGFFQDEFGPGHLLEDTNAAWQYFTRELNSMQSRGRYRAEPCGTGKKFVRVPMDIIKDSLVSPQEYFDAFMESSSAFDMPDIEAWKKEWSAILQVIKELDLGLEGFEEDEKALADMLEGGQAMVHHSARYRELYDPHYRIMTVEAYNKLIEFD